MKPRRKKRFNKKELRSLNTLPIVARMLEELETAKQAEKVEEVLDAVPENLRPCRGMFAAFLWMFGPEDLRKGAERIAIVSLYSETSAQFRRKALRIVKKEK